MIQAGMSEQQFMDAMRYAKYWQETMEETGYSWKSRTSGGWNSYLRRNGRGEEIKSTPEPLLFRRISTRKRIFGLVKKSEVVLKKRDPGKKSTCHCGECTRLEKYGWKNNTMPEMYMLFEFGEIKGQ